MNPSSKAVSNVSLITQFQRNCFLSQKLSLLQQLIFESPMKGRVTRIKIKPIMVTRIMMNPEPSDEDIWEELYPRSSI